MSLYSHAELKNHQPFLSDSKIEKVSKQDKEKVIITYNKSDVCGLKYIACVSVTEKRLLYCNSKLKKQTEEEIKKQAADKGGSIVFIDIKEKSGFGLFFTTTINGYVYE